MTGRRTEIIHYNLLIPVAEQPGLLVVILNVLAVTVLMIM